MLELTEREPIDDYAALRDAIAGLDVAVDWAVDDAGAGYASLRHIIDLRPRYVKLDRSAERPACLALPPGTSPSRPAPSGPSDFRPAGVPGKVCTVLS